MIAIKNIPEKVPSTNDMEKSFRLQSVLNEKATARRFPVS